MALFIIFDIIGIVSFVLSGFIIAREYKLDMMGVFIICSISALGGGVIRDIIVGNTPFIFTNYYPLLVVFCTIVILLKLKNLIHKDHHDSFIFLFSDAIGLVSFAITGALSGIEYHLNIFGVLALGMITAIGGGIIRDIFLNEIPYIFQTDFYASVALIISLLVYLLHTFYIIDINTLITLTLLGIVLRLIAVRYKWSLPKID